MKKNLCVIYLAIFALAMMPTRGWAETLPTTNWSDHANTDWYNSSGNPFTISSAAELAGLAQLVNDGTDTFAGDVITLAGDINLAAHLWTPIGTSGNKSFQGTFDGNGHVIRNLNVVMNSNYVGLFGYVGEADMYTYIRNLGIIGGSVQGADHVGGLAGSISHQVILTNCYSKAEVVGSGNYVGGLAGSIGDCVTLTNCYNGGSVQGTNYVGGLVGQVSCSSPTYSSTLINCYNSGTVSGTTDTAFVGGLAGEASTVFTHCYWLNTTATKAVGNDTAATLIFSYPFAADGILADGKEEDTTLLTALIGGIPWSTSDCYSWTNAEGSIYPVLTTTTVTRWDDPTYNSTAGRYEIYNALQLAGLAKIVNERWEDFTETVVLMNDIDLQNIHWTPIGRNSGYPFCGIFDGNGHTIKNLNVVMTTSYAGLFGYVRGKPSSPASICNLGIAGGRVQGTSNVGGLVGYASSTTLTNCYNHAEVVGSSNYVGGLAGYASGTTLTNCYSSGGVQGSSNVGGLVGYVSSSFLFNCYWPVTIEKAVGSLTDTPLSCSSFSVSTGKLTGTETSLADALNAGIPWSGTDYNSWTGTPLPGFGDKVTKVNTSWYDDAPTATSFTISSAEDLAGLAKLVNENIQLFSGCTITLAKGIDLENRLWTPIGTSETYSFRGTFDGNGKVIRNLNVAMTTSYAGLFGYVKGASSSSHASICNLGIAGGRVQGTSYVGGLVGQAQYATLTNCYNNAQVVGSGNRVGGLVGYAQYATLTNCYNSGGVTGGSYVGGLVGYVSSTTLTNCYWLVNAEEPTLDRAIVGNLTDTPSSCYSFDTAGKLADETPLVTALNSASDYRWGDADSYYFWVVKEGSIFPTFETDVVKLVDTAWYTDAAEGTTSFTISTAGELAGLAQLVNDETSPVNFSGKTITLANDMDLENLAWTPIGTGVNTSFRGTFDGNGHVIQNLNVVMNSSYVGLFGFVQGTSSSLASILNLGIDGGSVQGTGSVGGLVGFINQYTTLANCYNRAAVQGTGSNIGGLVGYTSATSLVINCYSHAAVSGSSNVGGLVGNIDNTSIISHCYWLAAEGLQAIGSDTYTPVDCYSFDETDTLADEAGRSLLDALNAGIPWGDDYYSWTAPNEASFPTFGADKAALAVTSWYDKAIKENPYTTSFSISTAGDLAGLAKLVNEGKELFAGKTILLTADINLQNRVWTPIGTSATYSFQGTFDGNGKVIRNLNVVKNSNHAGLFGYVMGASSSSLASILNLGIGGGSVQGTGYVGGLVGTASSYSTLTNCYNSAAVEGSSFYIGGLVGYAYSSTILTNCYNSGVVSLTGNYVGGLVGGANPSSAILSNCYWLSTDEALRATGDNDATLVACYSFNASAILQDEDKTPLLSALTDRIPWATSYCYDWTTAEGSLYPVFAADKVTKFSPPVYNAEKDHYEITTAAQLAGLANMVNEGTESFAGKTILLKADIDLLDAAWTPIGTSATNSFQGTFDGNGRVIRNLNVPIVGTYAGLFGYVKGTDTQKASILNLGIADGSVWGTGAVGGLAGYTAYANLTNCYNNAEVAGSDSDSNVGGLVGYTDYYVTLTNCYNSAGVKDTGHNIGGLVGYASSTITLTNCYWLNTASQAVGSDSGTLTNCYSFNTEGILADGNSTTLLDALNSQILPDGMYDWVAPTSGGYPTFGFKTITADLSWYNATDTSFEIKTVAQLFGLAELVNGVAKVGGATTQDSFSGKTITLANDMDLEDMLWTPIGISYTFKGTFDGKGHVIENMYVNRTSSYAGFFGQVEGTSSSSRISISNLGITGGSVQGVNDVAGLVGRASYVTFTNCYNNAQVTGTQWIGGLAGEASSVTFTNCYSSGVVQGDKYVGSLLGQATSGVGFTNSHWLAAGEQKSIGNGTATVTACYAFDADGVLADGNETTLLAALNAAPWGGEDCYEWIAGNPFPKLGEDMVKLLDTDWYIGDGPYEIKTAAQLAGLAKLVDDGNKFEGKTITLTDNIDLESRLWTPIGTTYGKSFSGTFDGNGHMIQNLNVNVTKIGNYAGLFGNVQGTSSSPASVLNLGIASGSVMGVSYVGGLVGEAVFATLANCYNHGEVKGNSTTDGNYIGGLVGNLSSSTLVNCYNSGSTVEHGTGNSYIGGLAGISTGSASNCYWLQTGGNTPAAIGNNNATLTACYPFDATATLQDRNSTKLLSALNNGFPWGIADCNLWITPEGSTYPQFSADKATTANTSSWYGDGSATTFSISSAIQLAGLAQLVNGGNNFSGETITLANDIDLEGRLWTPIGTKDNSFKGTFDGNGQVIQNLNVMSAGANNGLFGYVNGARISNLGIASGSVSGANGTGALVGNFDTVTLTNCYNYATVKGAASVGGLAGGENFYGSSITLTGCYNSGIVSGSSMVGSLVGQANNNIALTDCYWLEGSATVAIGSNATSESNYASFYSPHTGTPADATSITLYGKWDAASLNALSASLFTNPNCLRFIPLASTDVASGYNGARFIREVSEGTYQAVGDITLTDGYSFHTPHDFELGAYTISYTRNWTLAQRINGKGYGWNALTLPFDGDVYVGEETDARPHFTGDDTNGAYWLKRFAGTETKDETTTVTFDHEGKESDAPAGIQANIPYIIALPGADFGKDASMKGKTITIKATGITVTATLGAITDEDQAAAAYQYIGNYTPVDETGIYRLARGTTGTGDEVTPVEAFLQVEVKDDAPALKPFRAYFKAKASSNARRLVIGDGNGSTGITLPTISNYTDGNATDKPRKVMTKDGIRIIVGDRVYTVDGRLVELKN